MSNAVAIMTFSFQAVDLWQFKKMPLLTALVIKARNEVRDNTVRINSNRIFLSRLLKKNLYQRNLFSYKLYK